MRTRAVHLIHRLRRAPLAALSVLAFAGLGTAAALAGTSAHQAHLDALEAKAAAARKQQGLTAVQACNQYPTPEMTFDKKVHVKGGQTVTLHVPGHFVKGTGFVFKYDAVTLKRATVTAKGATLVAHVAKGAMPGTVPLVAVSPVCGAEVERDVLFVDAKTEWQVTMDNGWRLHLAADGLGSGAPCHARWSFHGKTRALPCTLDEWRGWTYRATVGGMADAKARMKRQMAVMQDPELLRLQKEVGKVSDEMGKCSDRKGVAAQTACLQGYSKKMQAIETRMKAARKRALHQAMKGAFGCAEVDLTVAGHRVSVDGSSCGDPDEVSGKGTVTAR